MRIDSISIGKNPPDDVSVIVEVPFGQPIKYKRNKASGALVVQRFLSTPITYPGNYGFVPHTLSEDGDAIDLLVEDTRPLVAGCVINVRPIGCSGHGKGWRQSREVNRGANGEFDAPLRQG